ATGEGSSALILSVMISASDSSFSTQSPSCLSQLPTVPSATDSPRRGIFTGVGMYLTPLSISVQFNRLRVCARPQESSQHQADTPPPEVAHMGMARRARPRA